MANLSITNVCNKKCVYCFASDTRKEFGQTYMDRGTFLVALEYVRRSGIKEARILGGEPTLHPEFIEFVDVALNQGLDIMLFTNGLMPVKVLEHLESVPKERLAILLNTIHPLEKNLNGTRSQQKVMARMGEAIIPGINLYSAKQELDYLLDYILKYNLKKEIRLGISHAVQTANNIYLHPKEYQKMGSKIILFKQKSKTAGISLGFDCGFVPCMFPSDHYSLLTEELKKAGTCCHPIIDLLTDGSFISCYPLNNFLKIKINNELVVKDLHDRFELSLSLYKNVGIYPHCSSCPLFNNRCNGGCMSFRISRYSKN
jgi:radical SAM protein with 4Fe4S-binding SPASM domain